MNRSKSLSSKGISHTLHSCHLVLIAMLLILSVVLRPQVVKAEAAGISVKEINYENSTIILNVNPQDTEVYFSDSSQKTWEKVPGEIQGDHTIIMDISWISISKNYELTLKGNKTKTITSITIPKRATNFRASYNKVTGKVTFSNAGDRTVEWRKKGSTIWNTVNPNTLTEELKYLYTNGATIYFRLAPVNGTSITNLGFRPSNEVTVTIPKKSQAPAIKIDGSKFIIPVKRNMAYRTVKGNEILTGWTNITSSTNLQLKDIATSAMYQNSTSAQEEVTLQFRTNATSSSQVSNISTVTIPVQEGSPDTDTNGISLSYTSSTTLMIEVKAASSNKPFEYTIVKENDELDYKDARWNEVTSSSPISISKSKAPEGSHIYLRKKSLEAGENTEFSLASTEIDLTGVNGVRYVKPPKADTLETIVLVAGICKDTDSSSNINFVFYSPVSTTISSIELYDSYGTNRGTVSCKSSVAKNTKSTDANDQYIITTGITTTSSIDQITEELLYAKLNFANSDTFTSTPTSGISLYLYPRTIVNNPSGEDYRTKFERIYLSRKEEDQSHFKFKLDLGTAKVMDSTEVNKSTSEDTAISKLQFNGYTLDKGKDYTVEYGSYLDNDKNNVRTATVTIDVANMEKSSSITATDETLPLMIHLNNNEVLKDHIYLNLISTATMDKAPIAWSITEGSLKETQTTTVTNPDGTSSTITEDVITFTIPLSMYDTSYGVSISDVTWGGISILDSAIVENGKATIYLSNKKINKLSTDSTETQNVIITLSNGFVIKNGCILTIIDNGKE